MVRLVTNPRDRKLELQKIGQLVGRGSADVEGLVHSAVNQLKGEEILRTGKRRFVWNFQKTLRRRSWGWPGKGWTACLPNWRRRWWQPRKTWRPLAMTQWRIWLRFWRNPRLKLLSSETPGQSIRIGSEKDKWLVLNQLYLFAQFICNKDDYFKSKPATNWKSIWPSGGWKW